jgi:hypothetical protein
MNCDLPVVRLESDFEVFHLSHYMHKRVMRKYVYASMRNPIDAFYSLIAQNIEKSAYFMPNFPLCASLFAAYFAPASRFCH